MAKHVMCDVPESKKNNWPPNTLAWPIDYVTRGFDLAEGVEGTAIYIYCKMVRTPWEYAIWLYGVSE